MISFFITPKPFSVSRASFASRRLIKLDMSSNLERFSSYLNGDWNNRQQSIEFPALWSYIHVCYHRLPDDFLGSPSFYVESAYDYSLDKPYKTAIIALNESDNKIEMENFKIKQNRKLSDLKPLVNLRAARARYDTERRRYVDYPRHHD